MNQGICCAWDDASSHLRHQAMDGTGQVKLSPSWTSFMEQLLKPLKAKLWCHVKPSCPGTKMFLPLSVFSLSKCSQVWLLCPSGFLKRKRNCPVFVLLSLEKTQQWKFFLLSGPCLPKRYPLVQMIAPHLSPFSNKSPLFCILKNTYCFKYYNKAKQLHFLRMHHCQSFLESMFLFWLKGLSLLFPSKNQNQTMLLKIFFKKI